ncbi:MAG: hypothetical protein R6V85_18740 [Polyangia bacterium]
MRLDAPLGYTMLALFSATAWLACGGGDDGGDEAGEQILRVDHVGLATPESALHDPVDDVYLVSNVNGEGGAKDGDGFVSRISPEGEVLELKWISGGSGGAILNAPKGMAISGEELFVADIDVLRVFERASGEPITTLEHDEFQFLNDVAAAGDGSVWVSDTAAQAIYRVAPDRSCELVASGDQLLSPNGIAIDGEAVWVASWAEPRVFRVDGGEISHLRETPAAKLDGLVLRADGTALVSSWDGEAIYGAAPNDDFEELFGGVESAADIGLDAQRGRLLVPLFGQDALLVMRLP